MADVGLVLAATRVPLTLFVLVGGVVGDRLPRRRVMLASDALRFATQGVAAALLLTHNARLWHLLVLFAVSGAAQAFFNPAGIGLVPELVPAEVLQEANALMNFARNSSALAGQLLGGGLVAAVGAGAAFAIDSGSFVISAVALGFLSISGAVPTKLAGAFLHELAEGWGEFRSRTWLWVGTLHVALLNTFALVAFFALGPVVAQKSLGGAASWGFIGAGFAAGFIAGSTVAVLWRPRRPLVVAFAVIFFAAPQLALLAVAAPVVAVAAASFFGGAQASVWGALWTTTIQSEIPSTSLSRVAAYGSLVLVPAGFAAIGYVAAATSISTVLWAGAVWIVASTAAVVLLPCIRAFGSTATATQPATEGSVAP